MGPAAVLCVPRTLCCSGVTYGSAVPCLLFTPCSLGLRPSAELAHPLNRSVWMLWWGRLEETGTSRRVRTGDVFACLRIVERPAVTFYRGSVAEDRDCS